MSVRASIDHTAIDTLRRQLAGTVAAPGDAGYDDLRQAWNATARQRPALAIEPATPDDVAAAVRFAAAQGRRVAVQATGHGAAGTMGDDVILLNLRALRGVEIDPAGATARVEAGATWAEVAEAAERHGLAGLAGTAAGVGVVGYTLHGGLGWLARAHGLASGSLLAVEYVDAAGTPRRATDTDDGDALWAFRGGAGVGIATAVELRLFPHPRVYGGSRFWGLEHAPAVLERWLEWTDGLPETITSLVWAFDGPDIPAFPPPFRGRAVIGLGAAGLDPAADRPRVDALLGALPEPLVDSFSERSPAALSEIQAPPPGPVPTRGDGRVLARPTPGVVAGILRASGVGRGGPLSFVELRHAGGSAAHDTAGGALTSLPGEFVLDAVAAAPSEERIAVIDTVFDAVATAAAPVDLRRTFAGFRGGRTDAPGALTPEHAARLRELRLRHDPHGRLFRPRELAV